MSQENLLHPPFNPNTPIGLVNMPRMYPPRLSPEQCRLFKWPEFINGLEPMQIIRLTDDIEIGLVNKTSLWTPADLCGFVGGNKDIFTIEDLSDKEGISFLQFHQTLAQLLHTLRSNTYSHFDNIYVVFGFNPEDFQLGAHSINRLHTHIFAPFHRLTDGWQHQEPLRKTVPWKELPWFDRLKFVEPFTPIFYDRITQLINQDSLFKGTLAKPEIEITNGCISIFFNSNSFPSIFPDLKSMYSDLRHQHSVIESLFTDRQMDSSGRYLPRSREVRTALLTEFLDNQGSWLSADSKTLLTVLSKRLLPAQPRIPANYINSSSQVWFTKGFAGALLFDFLKDGEITRMSLFPRIITTSAPEKGIYGPGRPTVIVRDERQPDPMELLNNELYLLGNIVACQIMANLAQKMITH